MASFVEDLASAIARFEGWGRDPKISVATRLNNPGNLLYAGQPGATAGSVMIDGKPHSYARFETPEAGWRALENQIRLDMSRGKSFRAFFYKYAPPTENSTETYLQTVAGWLGIPADKLDLPLKSWEAESSPFALPASGSPAPAVGYGSSGFDLSSVFPAGTFDLTAPTSVIPWLLALAVAIALALLAYWLFFG